MRNEFKILCYVLRGMEQELQDEYVDVAIANEQTAQKIRYEALHKLRDLGFDIEDMTVLGDPANLCLVAKRGQEAMKRDLEGNTGCKVVLDENVPKNEVWMMVEPDAERPGEDAYAEARALEAWEAEQEDIRAGIAAGNLADSLPSREEMDAYEDGEYNDWYRETYGTD